MCEKLVSLFNGLFTVVERIGSVACKLDLPSSTKIHPVIHILHINELWDLVQFPNINSDLILEVDPEALLGARQSSYGSDRTEVLVQWLGLPEWEATWNDFQVSTGQ